MSVTYVVIRAEEDPEWAERPIRWRPERGPYGPGGPGDPPRSQAVWVWGLFRRRPRRLEEVAKELRISRNQVHACLSRLRAHGHVIELEGDKYYCDRRREAGEAVLWVEETPWGLWLARPKYVRGRRRGPVVALEVRALGAGRVRRLGGEEVDKEEKGAPIPWQPERGPYGPEGPGDPPRSQAVWVWGLFRRRPRRLEEVAKELRISRNQVHACLSRLRAHGHVIERQGERYYCDRLRAAGEAVLWVEETPRGLCLARPKYVRGRRRGPVVALEVQTLM